MMRINDNHYQKKKRMPEGIGEEELEQRRAHK